MITFISALIALLLGYIIYGRITEKCFGVQADIPTPCYTHRDGVDYEPMATWRVFLIQFLNIAGTGPIFGAILGILYGPAAYLWKVFGCIFAGSVHDYLCGMICIRKGGSSVPEIVGDELGTAARTGMRIFSLILLILVGAVFTRTPADLLASLASGLSWSSPGLWLGLIFTYYILATLLPIGTLIGRIYPLFGLALIIMAVGVGVGIFVQPGEVPELVRPLGGHHPEGIPVFPALCITIACGAISGFHATQTPLMARCIKNERLGRKIFYGAMIAEGVVALVWAAASIKFASGLVTVEDGQTPYQALAQLGSPAVVVGAICKSWMGKVGAALAVLGVVAAPVTSGDTAFRSARLIATEFMGGRLKWRGLGARLAMSLPFFAIALCLFFIDFGLLWRYFGWCNQSLATLMLWAAAVWLRRHSKAFWLALTPAVFMTVVCVSYILVAGEGFGLPWSVGVVAGVVVAACLCVWFLLAAKKERK